MEKSSSFARNACRYVPQFGKCRPAKSMIAARRKKAKLEQSRCVNFAKRPAMNWPKVARSRRSVIISRRPDLPTNMATFLVRPVESSAGSSRDETESIVDCREFSAAELRRMIAENEIRDANTLTMCAELAAHGFLSLE